MNPDDVVTLTGQQLFGIYADGFCSGISSTFQTFSNYPAPVIIELAQRLADGLTECEGGKALIYNEIHERLTENDSGPKVAPFPVEFPDSLITRLAGGEPN
jgi:hypothetical protein